MRLRNQIILKKSKENQRHENHTTDTFKTSSNQTVKINEELNNTTPTDINTHVEVDSGVDHISN